MKQETEGLLSDKYSNMAYAVYEWKGLDGVPRKYPEHWLYNFGMCTMFVPEGWDRPVCLQVSMQSIEKNLYAEPVKWRAVAPTTVHGVTDVELNDRNAVLIKNDYLARPCRPFVDACVREMSNVESALRLNTNAHKMPFIFESPDGLGALQHKNDFVDLYEGEPVMFKNRLGSDEFKVWYSGVPFLGRDLADLYEYYDNRILSYLGVYESPVSEKKERLITGEVDRVDDIREMQLHGRLEMREDACEKFNELFPDFEVSVQLRRELRDDSEDDTPEEGDGEGGEGSS